MTHFISFGGPSPFYYRAVNRICGEAKQTKLFNTVVGYTDLTLKADTDFWKKHGDFINKNKKGYGYWLWKPYLIKKRLNELKDGELLFYTDAGSGFNLKVSNDFMKTRIEQVKKTKKIMGIFTCPERNYNKIDLVKYFGYEESPLFLRHRQHAAGAILMMKTPEVVKFINEWYELGFKDNYHFIDDTPSKEPETKHFIVHRHDQSIYSLLTKKYNILLKTSLRGPRESFFCTLRKRNGALITPETNHIGIDLEKANANFRPLVNKRPRAPKNKVIEKDVIDIMKKYLKNQTLKSKTLYNTMFTDIAFKRPKYLHIEFKNNMNKTEKHVFEEDKSIHLENVVSLENVIYSTSKIFKPFNVSKPSKDVTKIISDYLKNNVLSFKESYNTKFTDICYGKRKHLEIKYTDLQNKERRVIYKEDEPIHIENVSKVTNSIYCI